MWQNRGVVAEIQGNLESGRRPRSDQQDSFMAKVEERALGEETFCSLQHGQWDVLRSKVKTSDTFYVLFLSFAIFVELGT